MIQRRTTNAASKLLLFELPLKHTKPNAKPPQESKERILQTKALECLKSSSKDGALTYLISDGAPAYVPLSKLFGLKHGSCNHAKGVFVKLVRRGRQPALRAHTGTIDASWKLFKDEIPPSLASVKNGKPNPDLML